MNDLRSNTVKIINKIHSILNGNNSAKQGLITQNASVERKSMYPEE